MVISVDMEIVTSSYCNLHRDPKLFSIFDSSRHIGGTHVRQVTARTLSRARSQENNPDLDVRRRRGKTFHGSSIEIHQSGPRGTTYGVESRNCSVCFGNSAPHVSHNATGRVARRSTVWTKTKPQTGDSEVREKLQHRAAKKKRNLMISLTKLTMNRNWFSTRRWANFSRQTTPEEHVDEPIRHNSIIGLYSWCGASRLGDDQIVRLMHQSIRS